MSLFLSRLLGFTGSGLAVAAFGFPLTTAVAQEEREIVIQRVVEEKGEKEEKDDDDDDKEKASFWIGVALDGPGSLKIAQVLPDSPAVKAELKAGDVLVAVGDKKLERLEQLVDLVQDSQGRTLKIKFLRDGKEMVREIKPGKRPGAVAIVEKDEKEGNRYVPKPGQPGAANPGLKNPNSGEPGIAWRRVEVAPKGSGAPPAGSGTMHLYTAPQGGTGGGIQMFTVPLGSPPGVPTTGGSAFPPASPYSDPGTTWSVPHLAIAIPQSQLPDDMEVTVSKKGNKPAVVVARQGDKLWKTTENELGMLPPPAQAYASRLLGKDVMRARMPERAHPGMMPGTGSGAGMMMQPKPGAPAVRIQGAAQPQEVRAIELRLTKDGKIEAMQGGKSAPNIKVLPEGGFRVEIREGAEGKEDKNERKADKPAAEKVEPGRAERIRELQLDAEKLRGLLERLREEAKAQEKK